MHSFIENKFYQNKDWDSVYVYIIIISYFIENKFYQNKDWDYIFKSCKSHGFFMIENKFYQNKDWDKTTGY